MPWYIFCHFQFCQSRSLKDDLQCLSYPFQSTKLYVNFLFLFARKGGKYFWFFVLFVPECDFVDNNINITLFLSSYHLPGTMRLIKHAEVLVSQLVQEANEGGGGGHKDVHLVCDDGILAWSSLFIISEKVPALSEGIKSLVRCSFCTQPTTVILPGRR